MWTILEGVDYPRLAWEQQQGQPIMSIASPYGGGTGDPNDPYQIWTPEQFIEIAYQRDDFKKSFILMADIDLAGIDTNEVIPIGSRSAPFLGLFDGNSHTISNFRCICPGSPYTGVFGLIGWPEYFLNKPAGATGIITDLSLADAHICGGSNTGGIVGVSMGEITDVSVTAHVEGVVNVGGLAGHNMGTISNSSSSIIVSGESCIGGLVGINGHAMYTAAITCCHSTGTVNGGQRVGGLIGYNYNSIVECDSDCNVAGTTYIGGLIGYNFGELNFCHSTGNTKGCNSVGGLVGSNMASLCQCYATGMVTADGNNVGGLAGMNWGNSDEIFSSYSIGNVMGYNYTGGLVGYSSGSLICQCYSLSDVSGHNAVGGLIGKALENVELSYARGNVQGNDFVGGFIGVSCNPVVSCYSTGRVLGNSKIGGFFGRSWYKEVESCFWDILTSGETIGNGYYPSDLDGLIGETTGQMQVRQTYLEAGWDFVGETENGTGDIWWIDEGKDYPHLSWELAEEQ
jgi:hypothetical protein